MSRNIERNSCETGAKEVRKRCEKWINHIPVFPKYFLSDLPFLGKGLQIFLNTKSRGIQGFATDSPGYPSNRKHNVNISEIMNKMALK